MIVMKKISVIVPVYNVEGYLGECLDSVLACGHSDMEILCVNDGSTDGSAEVLAGYGNKIRVIGQENRGVSAARNTGLREATGEWIVFVDGDDRLHPDFFRKMGALQARFDADIVIGDYTTGHWQPVAGRERLLTGRELMGDHTAKCFVWGRVYRRAVLEGLWFREDMALGEDRAFNLELVCRRPGLRVARSREKLYHYRRREDSLVNQTTPESWTALGWNMLKICRETEKGGRALVLTECMKTALASRNAGMAGGAELVEACLEEMERTPGIGGLRRGIYWGLGRWKRLYAVLLWIKRRKERTEAACLAAESRARS